jgi:hypothetical protein
MIIKTLNVFNILIKIKYTNIQIYKYNMSYSISLKINLKNNPEHSITENIIYDAAHEIECTNIYTDYELEGINKYIKNNKKIIIIEFDSISNLTNILKLIKSIHMVEIEYIYDNHNLLYASKKYFNSLKNTIRNINNIYENIIKNKQNADFKEFYNILEN